MLATKSSSSMADSFADVVGTRAEADSPITPLVESDSQKWDRVVDERLIEWGRRPDLLSDDGIEPPSGAVIQKAFLLARQLKERGLPAPDTVSPDPNGGIVFERRAEDVAETFHVWEDGAVEYFRFQGTRLVERHSL
jgi:hypothetical protein